MLHSHKHIDRIHKKVKKQPKHHTVLIASIIYPLTTFPQILEIFSNKSAENISLLTYILYIFFTFIFLGYGIKEKLVPIVVLQSLWLVVYGLVVVGVLIYGS